MAADFTLIILLIPMLYTLQLHSESGNWASPSGTDSLSHHWSRDSVESTFDNWADTVGRYDARQDATGLVWKGHHDDVTDLYPDFQLTLGPRDGIRWEPC